MAYVLVEQANMIVKGFKGVVDDKARSVAAARIKTADSDGSVVG